MTFLHTMHGKYLWKVGGVLNASVPKIRTFKSHSKETGLELTRHRKKPPGGGRELKNKCDFNQFNAWKQKSGKDLSSCYFVYFFQGQCGVG